MLVSRPAAGQRRALAAKAASTNGVAPAPAAAKKAAKSPASSGPFTNTNRFKVSPEAVALFEAAWREREAAMQSFPGFQGFRLTHEADEWVAQSQWASIPEWESWSLSSVARRSHLPLGIWQYVPARGEGFPEDFTFIINYDKPVDAKY